MLHGILQHLKATYVTLEFAALTYLILMEAWPREGALAGPDPLSAALHFCPFDTGDLTVLTQHVCG